MSKTQKTYSVRDAAEATGYAYTWIIRLCQSGKYGVRIDVPENGTHFYRISKKEISTIKAAKKRGLRQSAKKQ